MVILGISAFYHDSAAALIVDGSIVAAGQEERFSRVKHDSSFPRNAISWCLTETGMAGDQVDEVIFYEKPFIKFDRIVETHLAMVPRGLRSFADSMSVWLGGKLFQKKELERELRSCLGSEWNGVIGFSEHHLSHAASAFYCSPFQEAVIITLDGVGEWSTGSIALGSGSIVELSEEMLFPHSVGLLYSAFTYFLGFKVNSGEYKVMGLAPYGCPIWADVIKKYVVNVFDDGSIHLNFKYFDFLTGLRMTGTNMQDLFGIKRRSPESELEQVHMDIAASIQAVVEEIFLKICRYARSKFQQKNLCLAGGVALNCVANGKLLSEGLFDSIWIQPAAGDAGGAIGGAIASYYLRHGHSRKIHDDGDDGMKGAYLGPSYSTDEILQAISDSGLTYKYFESEDELFGFVVQRLVDQDAIGWFQGAMEFGPRALGNRSILADPRDNAMQSRLNLKIKYRESFRPFAPAVLEEKASEWFDINQISPYMLFVGNVAASKLLPLKEIPEGLRGLDALSQQRSLISAVTHVDMSARIQTVSKRSNPRFHGLLEAFDAATNCPVLANTSFNVRNEPIVMSPKDAIRCFLGTELDVLVVDKFVICKTWAENKGISITRYDNEFAAD